MCPRPTSAAAGSVRPRGFRARLRLCVLLWAAMAMRPSVARGDEARPWDRGVAQEQKVEARRLFEKGNSKFSEKSYTEALKLYGRAVRLWDHPAIRFNIAECLMHLDQPLEAHAAILAAMRYGEAGLGRPMLERAQASRKQLEQRLGRLLVACEEPGAVVSLNGKMLFTSPGRTSRLLVPGQHQIVATKKGHITQTEQALVLPEKTIRLELRLPRLVTVPVQYERRWKRWKPWAVIGGGVVVGLAGVALQARAQTHYDAFDQELREACPDGCEPSELPDSADRLRSKAKQERVAGIAAYSVGGAVGVAGALLVLLNQPREVRTERRQLGFEVTAEGASMVLGWTF